MRVRVGAPLGRPRARPKELDNILKIYCMMTYEIKRKTKDH